jgi:hypothetical protein
MGQLHDPSYKSVLDQQNLNDEQLNEAQNDTTEEVPPESIYAFLGLVYRLR